MNTNNNEKYDPGTDENQGVITKLVQGEEANTGIAQADYMNPLKAQGPEPEKAEVNETNTDAEGINDDVLAEEEVENGNIDVEYEAGDN